MSSIIVSAVASSIENSQSYYSTKEKGIPYEDKNKCMRLIELFFKFFSNFMKLIGPLFFISLCLFIILVASSFFSVILPYYHFSLQIKLLLILLIAFLLFQIFFNYLMAFLVKPGSVDDISKSKFYNENNKNPFVLEEVDLYAVFQNKYSNKIIENHPEFDRVNSKFNIYPNKIKSIELILIG